jgi:hypothetical protein
MSDVSASAFVSSYEISKHMTKITVPQGPIEGRSIQSCVPDNHPRAERPASEGDHRILMYFKQQLSRSYNSSAARIQLAA